MHGLDEKGLAIPLGLVEAVKPTSERPHEQGNNESTQTSECEYKKRQFDTIQKEHGDEDQERKGVQHRQEQPTGQKLANTSGLLHVLDEYTRRNVLEEADW